MRRNFSNATKDLAWGRAGGKCELCGTTIGPFHYDHIVPDAMGGEATLDNCQVACKTCHGLKTHKADVPAIAKAKRLARKHRGIKKPRTILGGQTFRGEPIRYQRER